MISLLQKLFNSHSGAIVASHKYMLTANFLFLFYRASPLLLPLTSHFYLSSHAVEPVGPVLGLSSHGGMSAAQVTKKLKQQVRAGLSLLHTVELEEQS